MSHCQKVMHFLYHNSVYHNSVYYATSQVYYGCGYGA